MKFYHGDEIYQCDDLSHLSLCDMRSTNHVNRIGGWVGVKIKIKDHLSPAEAGVEG